MCARLDSIVLRVRGCDDQSGDLWLSSYRPTYLTVCDSTSICSTPQPDATRTTNCTEPTYIRVPLYLYHHLHYTEQQALRRAFAFCMGSMFETMAMNRRAYWGRLYQGSRFMGGQFLGVTGFAFPKACECSRDLMSNCIILASQLRRQLRSTGARSSHLDGIKTEAYGCFEG